MIGISKVLWYKRNKAFLDMPLLENIQRWGDNSNSVVQQATADHPVVDLFS